MDTSSQIRHTSARATSTVAPSEVSPTAVAPSAPGSAPSRLASETGHQHEATARRLSDRCQTEICWVNVTWLVILHIGALAAPFFFSWQGLVVAVVLHWFTGSIGICMGYHRYLTHASFQTYRPVRWMLAWIGGMAGEGSAIEWVANHRKHHAHSDHEGDPHSPRDGKWWSHMFWLAWCYPREQQERHVDRWAPDIARDSVFVFLHRTFLLWHLMFGGALYAAGHAMGGSHMAWSLVTWGMFVRLVFVLHATWFVNSASHIWGYRNYVTTDLSRNNWWVSVIAYGEGWHNNHHAFPRMAAHGHRWWEIDVTFWAIRLLQSLGLAWDVVDYKRGGEKVAKSVGVTRRQTEPALRKSASASVVASNRL